MAFTNFSARPSKAEQQAEKERAAREKAARKAERTRRSREQRRREEAESARRWWEQQRQRSYAPSSSARIATEDREIALEILGTGLRAMARRHHPDLGGDHDTMVAINRVADKLRDIINGK